MSAAPVQPVPQRSAASVVRTLHGVLMLGVVAATATFIALVHVAHVGPLMPGLAIAGYALALVSLLDIVIALLLRSKIPARSKDQTTDAY